MKFQRFLVLSVFVALAGGLQYAFWFGKNSIATLKETRQMIDTETQTNIELAKRNDVLRAEVVDLKFGDETMEERARMELGLIKDGEVFYRIVNTGPATNIEN